MNNKEIVKLYLAWKSMRNIAIEFWTNHKLIWRILKSEWIEIRKPLNLRWKNKFECKNERLYNNMAKHLRFEVGYEWLMQFKDIEKLKVLNNCIAMRSERWLMSTEWYKLYLLKFYNDNQFNLIYKKWIDWNKYKYLKPSIDHIIPISKWWTNDIENLQFLTWFENRCKNDMTQEEWSNLKNNINNFICN